MHVHIILLSILVREFKIMLPTMESYIDSNSTGFATKHSPSRTI